MKVYFASDLHYDVGAGKGASTALARYLDQHATADDVLLLGGDYGNDDDAVEACLALFADFPGHRLAIAGNHDAWVDTDVTDSRARIARLSEQFDAAGFRSLEEEPAIIDGVGFAGAIGWYDYSFRVESLEVPIEVYESKGYPGAAGAVWNDARFVDWGVTDPEFTREQGESLARQLEALRGVERAIVVTHHVPTEALLRPDFLPPGVDRASVVPRKWLILNTYLGSSMFEDIIVDAPVDVELALCGHIHLGRSVERRGVRFVSNGSNHKTKELVVWRDGMLERLTFAPA